MQAVRLRQFDLDYRNHAQAFLNFAVTAKKKSGKNKEKPVYSRFSKFFNYEKNEELARNGEKAKSRISSRLEEYYRKEGYNG